MKFGSICSGIESASVAWEPLGMSAAWFSEIEKFPSAVLAHHWPHIENLGDMNKLPDMIRDGLIEAPDILVGGTPCQAFSVAGKRKGLDDDRGQLTLKYVEIANEIDKQRPGNECVTVWENVPGVLSSKDNAFGCFLGELAGEDCELIPSGKKWSNAGCVYGPQRTIAWRVLDAQFFGVAQRRRRVFVVASARKGFNPESVLFESEGVRRDIKPSRETGEATAGFTPSSFGQYNEGCGTLKATGGDIGGGSETLVVRPIHDKTTRHAGASGKGSGNGFGVGKPSDPCPTLTTGDHHAVCYSFDSLSSNSMKSSNPVSGCRPVDLCSTIDAQPQDPSRNQGGIAVCVQGSMIGRSVDNGPQGSGLNDNVSFTLNCTDRHAVCADTPPTVRKLTPVECERLQGFPDNHTRIPWRGKPAEDCPDGPRYKAAGNSKAVPVVQWLGIRLIMEYYK